MSHPSKSRALSPAIALVVTALLMLTVVSQARFYQNVKWDAPQIVAAAFRGEDGSPKPAVYSDAALNGLFASLSTAVAGGFDQVRPAKRKLVLFGKKFEYQLSGKLTELFDGALSVEVAAIPNGGKDPVKTWTHTVEKGGDAATTLATIAAAIGAELAAQAK